MRLRGSDKATEISVDRAGETPALRVLLPCLRGESLIRSALCLLCALGAYVSGELLKLHAGPWPSGPEGGGLLARFCSGDAGSGASCSAALESHYGSFDLDLPVFTSALSLRRARVEVPVAFVGLSYFTLLGVWHALAGPSAGWGRIGRTVTLSIAAGGATGSIVFLSLLLIVVQSTCPLCIAVHSLNLVVLLGTAHLWHSSRMRLEVGSVEQDSVVLAAAPLLRIGAACRGLVFAAVLIAGCWLIYQAKLDVRRQVAKLLPYKEKIVAQQRDAAFLLREFQAGPVQPASRVPPAQVADEAGERFGTVGAVVRGERPSLLVFGDFACSHCACFASRWSREFSRLWDTPPRVDFKHFPLCKACNQTVERDLHPEACRAAAAAAAARLQGGDEAFWRMHDLLFQQRDRLDGPIFGRFAGVLRLDAALLAEDMAGPEVAGMIGDDIALAKALGVSGTPAVFYNGRRVPAEFLFNRVFWKALAQQEERPGGPRDQLLASTEDAADTHEANVLP